MNGVAQLGLPITIEVNYDSGLSVGMTVLDDSGIAPAQVGAIIAMTPVTDTLYRAKFTPAAAKSYIFRKAVYTDGTFATLAPDYPRASESIQVLDFSSFLAPIIIYRQIQSFIAEISAAAAGSFVAAVESSTSITAFVAAGPKQIAFPKTQGSTHVWTD